MVEVKYSKLWYEVSVVIGEARSRVESIVRRICDLVYEDVGGTLDEMSRRYGFTYVIEPVCFGGDLGGIVPCVLIEATGDVVERVADEVTRLHPDVVSNSRLRFMAKPKENKELEKFK